MRNRKEENRIENLAFNPTHRVKSGSPCFMATLLTFGDSTTALRNGVEVYTTLLAQEGFLQTLHPVRFLNRGVPANTTALARERFERDVLAEKPDLVVIQFGINDAAIDVWKEPPATGPRVPLDEYEANLRYFVTTLRQQGAQVILMTPNQMRWAPILLERYAKPPYDPEAEDGFTRFLALYAQRMREIARAEGVPLIDIYTLYGEWEAREGRSCGALMLDGHHPNSAGHRLVAETLRPVVEEWLRASPAIP